MIQNFKFPPASSREASQAGKIRNSPQAAFTLIELMVAIFIFSVITAGIISVFVSSTSSYQKARAIKEVKENVEYAVSSIAKEVRMGKIEYYYSNIGTGSTAPLNGSLVTNIVISRNRGGTVCYKISDSGDADSELDILSVCDSNCSSSCSELVSLENANMSFANTSGFYSCPSAVNAVATCPAGVTSKRRGWVEVNLNITMTAGKEMEADEINVQTIVSSRDYGWEDI